MDIVGRIRRHWRWLGYLLEGFFGGTAAWVLLLAHLFTLAAMPLGGVVPLVLPVVPAVRALAGRERTRAARLLGTPVPRPYRPIEGGLISRIRTVLTDRATWRDLAWLPVHGCYGWIAGVFVAGLWASAAFGLTLPLWWAVVPDHLAGSRFDGLPVDHLWGALLAMPMGVLNGGLALLVCRPLALGEARLAAALLRPSRRAELTRRVAELASSRAETVDARAAELRRIERDLHDGAQARLVSLAMSLGLAEESLHGDPRETQRLLAEARESAGTALAELRDLVRGIHPPVLADRGLTGALQALALQSPVPVRLDLSPVGRVPGPVESALYFVAAEGLANAIKHAAATRVTLSLGRHRDVPRNGDVPRAGDVPREGDVLRLEIGDDGRGGARAGEGGGLAGIAERVAAFDGRLSLHSPNGGPTMLCVEVPCAS